MRHALLLISALILGGCGHPSPSYSVREEILQTTYSNSPVLLSKYRNSCDKSEKRTNIFELEVFLSGLLEQRTADFSLIMDGPFIRDGKVISETFYGEKTEIIQNGREYSVQNHAVKKVLEICQDEMQIPREAVESAALKASYFIHKIHRRFTAINPEVKITPVVLNITPEIIQSWIIKERNGHLNKLSRHMTDNAFYMPLRGSITFLPHSRDAKLMGQEVNFWEVPMISSHEYGHHLFQMIYQSRSQDVAAGCFNQNSHKDDLKSQSTRKVSIDEIIKAFNEGFADLMAYYSLEEHERNLQNIKCLEVSRDVGSSAFYDGTPKRFSKEAMRSFFSENTDIMFKTCEDVDYQQIHTIGAILAYSANHFFEHLNLTEDERIKVIVSWVQYLKSESIHSSNLKPEAWFTKTVGELFRSGVNFSGKEFNKKSCRELEYLFPGLNLSECENY